MASKVGVGVWAGVGSVLGLFAGSLLGASLSKGRPGAAAVVLPALAGTALGAGLAAALSAAEPNTTTVTTTTTGAGALPSTGLGASPHGEPERYDPARYAGKRPPHECTKASATKIAQQIDPNWRFVDFEGCFPSDPRPSMTETMTQVTTPMGAKTIPIWTDNALPGGGRNRGRMPTRLILQCPYTGALFQFFQASALGVS